MIAGDSIQYSSKTADFDLRESISRLQGQIDLLCYGILDENTEEENSQFLHKLKNGADNLYQILNYSIIDKANRLEQVVKELNETNKIIKKKNMQIQNDINLARSIRYSILISFAASVEWISNFLNSNATEEIPNCPAGLNKSIHIS